MLSADHTMGVPAFLGKLRKMVDDPETDELICWTEEGDSFMIRNEIDFCYTLLPAYYKHSNMSSFVRQLNMYGFHKLPDFNMNTHYDKMEYRFTHPFFKKDHPELLQQIKRKVTTGKSSSMVRSQPVENPSVTMRSTSDGTTEEQLANVLAEVKGLQNRQTRFDNVIRDMKQENTVLWRELAVLRQKHQKQQQIVNKLIQFLVTVVQPARMGGLRVKRRYPLMINENPRKKRKKSSTGPTIHELDSADVLAKGILSDNEDEHVQVESPVSTNQQIESPLSNLDDLSVEIDSEDLMQNQENTNNQDIAVDELLTDSEVPEMLACNSDIPVKVEICDEGGDSDQVFLNPAVQDSLISDLINGSYNSNILSNGKNASKKRMNTYSNDSQLDMTVATRDPNLSYTKIDSGKDPYFSPQHLDAYVGGTQAELDQLKEFFQGCSGIDSSYLLNLFNEAPSYGLIPTQNDASSKDVSGSEITPYDSDGIDLTEAFDEFLDMSNDVNSKQGTDLHESLNTPDINYSKPFAWDKLDKKK